ncbi:hypothetical protein N658DRAFT_518423 [Parathielavia hyrcaniae]|uniref:Uncharacterized protein n=1 Tax=Parathielavia hyrcaniae TaxID=113614 RepID=A0AAN6PTX4_9PEZI|nr:hypothetical protein N658DRAFT_518423 [Parathielavia hyrcaniae]
MASSVFRLAPLPNPPVPLPRVPGPKLAPFNPDARADIEFVEFVGRENNLDSQVWRVKINGAALHQSYFCHSETLRTGQGGDLARPLATSQLYCRANGRLEEEKREDLAVKAYGYLLLTPQQEIYLARKELVSGKAPNPHEAQHMWSDLDNLHLLGIFVGDTHGGNCVGGKLVDFSRSWTMYHPASVHIRDSELQGLMLEELQHLLDYYYLLKNSLPRTIAISQDLEAFCSGHISKYNNLPSAYNWLKWEKSSDMAKAYVDGKLFERAAL